jgi:hypothetical protein
MELLSTNGVQKFGRYNGFWPEMTTWINLVSIPLLHKGTFHWTSGSELLSVLANSE